MLDPLNSIEFNGSNTPSWLMQYVQKFELGMSNTTLLPCRCVFIHITLQVVKVRPNDKDARLKFTECKKIVHQQAFAKAIAVDDEKSVVETLDLDSMGRNL